MIHHVGNLTPAPPLGTRDLPPDLVLRHAHHPRSRTSHSSCSRPALPDLGHRHARRPRPRTSRIAMLRWPRPRASRVVVLAGRNPRTSRVVVLAAQLAATSERPAGVPQWPPSIPEGTRRSAGHRTGRASSRSSGDFASHPSDSREQRSRANVRFSSKKVSLFAINHLYQRTDPVRPFGSPTR